MCSYKGCNWSTGEEGTDWGYFSTTNGDCTYCTNECDKDETCEGVECGGSHCSWWKNGKCDETYEHTLPSNGIDKMCVKTPYFLGETNFFLVIKRVLKFFSFNNPIC